MSPLLDFALNVGILSVAAAVLMCSWRLFKGPDIADRVLALDTLYMSVVALIILLDMRWDTVLLFEAALIVAMLGFVSTVALARYINRGDVVE
ncbi:MAG: K+/H+ antiporter subunit F [Burkholderiales bacterium]|nr:MAG: K+/H+ antiporter subunit F [Burkholderiales bacterium]